MVRLFQRVVRSFEVGLVVAARCVCVFLMVLRSVDVLRPNVASFSCTRDRASAKMSAALSSTPRVSVCPRVVVRVGPILCALWQPRGRLLLGSRWCLCRLVRRPLLGQPRRWRAVCYGSARRSPRARGPEQRLTKALPVHNRPPTTACTDPLLLGAKPAGGR